MCYVNLYGCNAYGLSICTHVDNMEVLGEWSSKFVHFSLDKVVTFCEVKYTLVNQSS